MANTRIKLSDVKVYTILLPEVNGKCPLCGAYPLSEEKNGKTYKNFEIAHIYPHSPTEKQLKSLKNVVKHDDVESIDNLIVLCKQCHGRQDLNTTEEEYNYLLSIKKRLKENSISRKNLGNQHIDTSILKIIYSLKKADFSNIPKMELRTTPLKVDQKIINNPLLLDNIRDKVLKYFVYIQEQFRMLEGSNSNNFELIASQIKTAYIQAKSSGISQEAIFNQLVYWLESLDNSIDSKISCGIMVSFFIQDCEVFDEISK